MKYLYDLGDGQKEYTVKEIADTLKLNTNLLKEYLLDYNNDIVIAAFNATKDKGFKESYKKIIDSHSIDFLKNNNINDILSLEIDINSKRRSFVNTLEFSLNKYTSDYCIFNKSSFNLLFFNYGLNDNKKDYFNDDELSFIKNLYNIASGKYKNNIPKDNYFTEAFDDIIKNSIESKGLTLSNESTKKLLELANSKKIPVKYNEEIMKTFASNKRETACISYMRK